jgi:hypothetical protein
MSWQNSMRKIILLELVKSIFMQHFLNYWPKIQANTKNIITSQSKNNSCLTPHNTNLTKTHGIINSKPLSNSQKPLTRAHLNSPKTRNHPPQLHPIDSRRTHASREARQGVGKIKSRKHCASKNQNRIRKSADRALIYKASKPTKSKVGVFYHL